MKSVNIPQSLEQYALYLLNFQSVAKIETISTLLRDKCGNGNVRVVEVMKWKKFAVCTIFFKTTNQRFPTICKLIRNILIPYENHNIYIREEHTLCLYNLDAQIV